MNDQVNNATDSLPTDGAGVPIGRPEISDRDASHNQSGSPQLNADQPDGDSSSEIESFDTLPNIESVHRENQVGSTDITGEDDPDSLDDADSAVEAVAATPKPAAPKLSAPKKNKMPALDVVPDIDAPVNRQWYILKVQTNREDSIRDALQRRVAMEGLDRFFGDIIVPVEMITEFKNGKKRTTKRKLYPGYLVVNMEINDDTWYLVRETSGIGDFTGAMGRPSPMAPQDIAKLVLKTDDTTDDAPKLKISFKQGDRVKINEGTFDNFEGNVETIDEANGRVTVMINIFGRSTPVELEYWQIEAV